MVCGSLKNSLIVRIVVLGFIVMINFAGCAGMGSPSPDGNSDGVLLGVFHEGSQLDLALIKLMEKQLEKKIASVMWYLDWSTPFPSEDVQRVYEAGYMPHITWEPWFFENPDMITLDLILPLMTRTIPGTGKARQYGMVIPVFIQIHPNGAFSFWNKSGGNPELGFRYFRSAEISKSQRFCGKDG